MQVIGFIGLGIMGKPMAHNLMRAGFPLHFYARNPEIVAEFKAAGATAYSSPKDLAPHADIIITNLPVTADVESVLIGANGVIESARPGTLVIDMSTIAADETKRIAATLLKKQIAMLDAPVSGGEKGAIDGTLSIMVGGPTTSLEVARPVFAVLGKQVVHIGEQHGAGQTAKACNQIIIAETIVAVSEALRLAKAAGVNPAKVREALLGGFAASRVLEIHGKRMLDKDYKPGFKASLHRKDMHLALELAEHLKLNLPAAKFASACIDEVVNAGHSEKDSSAVHLLTEE